MNIASIIDHTVLKPTTTLIDVKKICEEADRFQFASVCIPPYFVSEAATLLKNSNSVVCTVIGFPFGYAATAAKAAEMEQAITDGARELDMVINLAALKNGDHQFLHDELAWLSRITQQNGRILKVIIESGILSNEEVAACCEILKNYPLQFVKTSTGYAEKGASVAAVQLMRRHLPSTIGIKASGGIKTFSFARELVQAGATRLGCSASVAIINGESAASHDY